MASVGIIPGLVIGLREGIEAALIVGLIAGYLTKTGRGFLNKHVIMGTVLAVIASLVVAGVLVVMSSGLEGTSEEMFEGVSAIIAVVVLTFMIFWMMNASRDMREHFQNRVDAVASRREALGLIGFAFVAVFREGVETALFMLGAAEATTTSDAVIGVALGVLIATFIGIALPRLSVRVSWKRFFQATSVILILFAAGLFARGVHELQEAFSVETGSASIYDLSGVFSSGEDNPAGYLLRGILGYSDSPSQVEAAAYISFLSFCIFLYWHIVLRKRTGEKDDVSATEAPKDPETEASSVEKSEVAVDAQSPSETTAIEGMKRRKLTDMKPGL